MIIGPAIKPENFRLLNRKLMKKKAAVNAAFFIKTEILEIYLISISFCVLVKPAASACTKYTPLEASDASQVSV